MHAQSSGGKPGTGRSPTSRRGTAPLTANDLADHGITEDDLRRRCPRAVEYVGLGGEPCWRAEELAGLLVPEVRP